MKKILFLFSVVLAFASCSKKEATTAEGTQATSKILFEEPEFNFGKIKQGDVVANTFIFKNVGESNLIISNAVASCGCTIPEWPKEPIKPGDTGQIKVQFNSTGKSGVQNKTVTVTANTDPNTTNVVLKGEVEVPATVDSSKTK